MTATVLNVDSLGPSFEPWPKIPRLNRDIVVTEKIDGTNAAVGIRELENGQSVPTNAVCGLITEDSRCFYLYAQSRTRIITQQSDNHGFAQWVFANASTLLEDLGPGLHFGEWWGSGIQRGYGLEKGEKRFSLFNTSRHDGKQFATPGMRAVPVLYNGPFKEACIWEAQSLLRRAGSIAAPGFKNPEGVVIYHGAANQCFKVTLENDEAPKEQVSRKNKTNKAGRPVYTPPTRSTEAAVTSPALLDRFQEGLTDY